MAWDINGPEVNLHDRKETLCKKDVFWADCRNDTHNDSNHIGRILSDQKYCSVMGWDGFDSLCNTVDAFYGTTVGNETVNFTSELCQILDDMMNRSQEPENVSDKETIFARIHHRLVRLYNILQESNRKVEAERQELQSLVSDISHQVRTPVSNMKMIVDTLLTKPLEEQERNEFLKSVRGQINKLDFLIQALVKTSRLETGVIQLEKEEHFLYDTLAQAMSGILYSAEQKKIHVSVECPEDLCVSHDSKWTEEAIFNLLDNAVKYTSTGGHVNVSVAQWEMYVEIKVSDTGKGISESNQASIFKRFYREEEIHNQPGVGIGLYLTREIVTQQGGYVTVESQVGKGSAFSIFLPR